MSLTGTVVNGVVVFDEGQTLPDGTKVLVRFEDPWASVQPTAVVTCPVSPADLAAPDGLATPGSPTP